jgi:cell wall-associated NlpC family hydrolase
VPGPGPVALVTPERAGGGEPGAVRATVVNAALAAMGTPYSWGGSDSNGFDCSGLIRFAYQQAGISLPRQSAEQAATGTPVDRDPAALLPGDILAFATSGSGAASHVGLYLGEGRFIHSATGGVQVSVLSASDPYGRWWVQRWVGARRVVGGGR